jgi:hypothetical protein
MQVQKEDMGLDFRDHLHGYRESNCFADDLDARFVFQDALEWLPA